MDSMMPVADSIKEKVGAILPGTISAEERKHINRIIDLKLTADTSNRKNKFQWGECRYTVRDLIKTRGKKT